MLPDFVNSFEGADQLIMAEIFPSFREKIDKSFSSKMITDELKEKGKNAAYYGNNEDMIEYISSKKYDSKTIIIE